MNPVIEAFRGAAALMVLLHHYTYAIEAGNGASLAWVHYFHNGVDLFFVITGYLFAPYLLGESRVNPAAFAIRRVFRLYPLYLISLAVGVGLSWGQKQGVLEALLKHLLFVQALPVYSLAEAGFFSLVYWTLPVEMAFYALVAAGACVVTSSGAGTGAQGRSLDEGGRSMFFGIVAIACFVSIHAWNHDPRNEGWVLRQAQLPAVLIEFWFGMLIHRALPVIGQSRQYSVAALIAGVVLLSGLLVGYGAVSQISMTARPFGPFNVFSALGYALSLAGALGLHGLSRAGKRGVTVIRRVALGAGALSYGVYLFHEWAIAIVASMADGAGSGFKVMLAMLLTLLVAALLHVCVEKPSRESGRRLAREMDRRMEARAIRVRST